MTNLPKIIIIAGPTASGKTDLSIALAKKFNGEIVSADSRQIYKKMSIGTAKPIGEWKEGNYLVGGVLHYLVDIVEPDAEFTLANFKEMAQEKISNILSRGKLPIVVGGTGLYIWSLVENLDMPAVAPDLELRAELEKKSLEELVRHLREIDSESADKIDLKNPRRVLRALEVCLSSGGSFFEQRKKSKPLYNCLQIGLLWPREELNKRIGLRVDLMMKDGLLEEVKKLAALGYNWKLPSTSGIGNKQMGYYLRGEKTLAEAVDLLKKDTRNYAKRQMTWFKRDKKIRWIEKNNPAEAFQIVRDFIS